MSSDGPTPDGVRTAPPPPPAPPAPPVPPAPPTPPDPQASSTQPGDGNAAADKEHAGGKMGHHISDIDTWKHADRNYFVFVILSVLLGLLGADHFYLRSFHTGMMKIVFNIFTLGMWHYWDLIQIVYDGRKIREEGLTSPFDWICGIGRGVFTSAKTDADSKKYVAEKSYLIYAALAIFFGFLGADKFYMGETWQGIAKVLSVFNIFLFLFGFLWVLWDSFHALFMTKSILENGISAPLPYNMFFKEAIDGKQFLVTHLVTPEDAAKGGFGGIDLNPFSLFNKLKDELEKVLPTVPIPTVSYKGLYSDLVVPFMTPTVVAAINASKSTDPILKMPELPDAPTMPGLAKFGLPTTLPTGVPSLPSLPTVPSVPSAGIGMPISQAPAAATVAAPAAPIPANLPPMPSPAVNAAAAAVTAPNGAKAAFAPTPIQKHSGGARNEFTAGPGPAIAGVLTAVVLAGGLKGFYDIISKQYG
jgi:TM2 domain-containing membrane protein YozV